MGIGRDEVEVADLSHMAEGKKDEEQQCAQGRGKIIADPAKQPMQQNRDQRQDRQVATNESQNAGAEKPEPERIEIGRKRALHVEDVPVKDLPQSQLLSYIELAAEINDGVNPGKPGMPSE